MIYFLYEFQEGNLPQNPPQNSPQSPPPQDIITLEKISSKWIYIQKIQDLHQKLNILSKKTNNKDIKNLSIILNDIIPALKLLPPESVEIIYNDLTNTILNILKK